MLNVLYSHQMKLLFSIQGKHIAVDELSALLNYLASVPEV